mmetsp:Transcript_38928/g.77276  ORF Transcript_38928/g.77276 Transcript_38928/m.77276 type:complete len:81 (+) Transcript_38928:238-480(+)
MMTYLHHHILLATTSARRLHVWDAIRAALDEGGMILPAALHTIIELLANVLPTLRFYSSTARRWSWRARARSWGARARRW